MRKVMAITMVIGLITIAMINISNYDLDADVQQVTKLSSGAAEEIIVFLNDGDTHIINVTVPATATITKAIVNLEGDPILDSITYGQPDLISNDINDKDSTDPSLKIDNNNNSHLVWVDNGNIQGSGNDQDVYYRFKPQQQSWTEIILISDATPNSNSVEPSVTVDSQNNTYVAWVDDANYMGSGNDNDIFLKNRTGGTWNIIAVISDHIDNGASTAPELVTDQFDNLHIVWVDDGNIDGSGFDTDIVYRKYNSTSQTWENPVVISDQSNDGDSKNPSILPINGYIHIVWEDNSNYSGNGDDLDILYKFWDPTLNAWSTTFTVSTAANDGESLNASVGVDPIGDVYFTWEDDGNINGSGTDFDIVSRKYYFQTATWTNTTIISNSNNDKRSISPTIIPGLFGNYHTIWCDDGDISNSGLDFDIIHKRFDRTFNNYSTPMIITTDVNDGNSYDPAIESVIVMNQYQEDFYVAWVDDGDVSNSGLDPDIIYLTYSINYSYPSDLKLDVGNKGSWDWNYTGIVNSPLTIGDNATSNWLSSRLNSIIENSTSTGKDLIIPFKIYSSTKGLLKVSDLNITYTLIPDPPTGLKILNELDDTHLLDHIPVLSWTFNDQDSLIQGWFELEVGSTPGSNDLWDLPPVQTSETNLTYAGAEVVDGGTYYFKVRTRDNDGSRWGGWSANKSFRFNTPPEVSWLEPVEGTFSSLININWNTTDAENDDRYSTLEVYYNDDWHELTNSTSSEFYEWDVTTLPAQTADIRVRCRDGLEYSPGGWFNPSGIITIHRNTPPIIQITSPPSTEVRVNTSVNIRWQVIDPDVNDTHTVDLYYDTDTNYQSKVLIKNDLEGTTEHTWDTTTIQDGVYYICAIVSDGVDTSYTYSEGVIIVDHTIRILPPKISLVYPPQNSQDIATDTDIWVLFNVPIDGNSVTSKSFMVLDSTNQQISGVATYDVENKEARFDPDTNLTYNESYTVHLTTGIRDLAGNGLDGDKNGQSEASAIDDFTWIFRTQDFTGDINSPRVIYTDPINNATNVDNSTIITIKFSEDMDSDALFDSVLFFDEAGNFVLADKLYSPDMFSLTLLPLFKLLDNMTYIIVITSAARDLAGRSLDGNGNGRSEGSPWDDYRLTFTTGAVIANNIGPPPPPPGNGTDDSEDGSNDMFLLLAILIIIIIIVISLLVFRRHHHGDFEITNIFVIYSDGRLLTRYHRKSEKAVDDSAVSSMLTAIQDFIHDSFRESGGNKGEKTDAGDSSSDDSINELKYGKMRIFIEHDKKFYIAVIGEGKEIPPRVRKQLKKLKSEINTNHHKVLEFWDGNMAQVKGMRALLEPMMKK